MFATCGIGGGFEVRELAESHVQVVAEKDAVSRFTMTMTPEEATRLAEQLELTARAILEPEGPLPEFSPVRL